MPGDLGKTRPTRHVQPPFSLRCKVLPGTESRQLQSCWVVRPVPCRAGNAHICKLCPIRSIRSVPIYFLNQGPNIQAKHLYNVCQPRAILFMTVQNRIWSLRRGQVAILLRRRRSHILAHSLPLPCTRQLGNLDHRHLPKCRLHRHHIRCVPDHPSQR